AVFFVGVLGFLKGTLIFAQGFFVADGSGEVSRCFLDSRVLFVCDEALLLDTGARLSPFAEFSFGSRNDRVEFLKRLRTLPAMLVFEDDHTAGNFLSRQFSLGWTLRIGYLAVCQIQGFVDGREFRKLWIGLKPLAALVKFVLAEF